MRSARVLLAMLAGCAGSEGEIWSASDSGPAQHASGVELDADFKGCPDGLATFEPGLRAEGMHHALTVLDALPAEPERYSNRWTLELAARDGTPAPQAAIVGAQTFMPVHGHDGRVEPEISALAQRGRFEVDRLNFTMRGPWEVRLWLRSPSDEAERVVFDVCVAR